MSIFGDLDWPLNASRGLSTAAFLVTLDHRYHRRVAVHTSELLPTGIAPPISATSGVFHHENNDPNTAIIARYFTAPSSLSRRSTPVTRSWQLSSCTKSYKSSRLAKMLFRNRVPSVAQFASSHHDRINHPTIKCGWNFDTMHVMWKRTRSSEIDCYAMVTALQLHWRNVMTSQWQSRICWRKLTPFEE